MPSPKSGHVSAPGAIPEAAVRRFAKVLHVNFANLHQTLVSEYQQALEQVSAGQEEESARPQHDVGREGTEQLDEESRSLPYKSALRRGGLPKVSKKAFPASNGVDNSMCIPSPATSDEDYLEGIDAEGKAQMKSAVEKLRQELTEDLPGWPSERAAAAMDDCQSEPVSLLARYQTRPLDDDHRVVSNRECSEEHPEVPAAGALEPHSWLQPKSQVSWEKDVIGPPASDSQELASRRGARLQGSISCSTESYVPPQRGQRLQTSIYSAVSRSSSSLSLESHDPESTAGDFLRSRLPSLLHQEDTSPQRPSGLKKPKESKVHLARENAVIGGGESILFGAVGSGRYTRFDPDRETFLMSTSDLRMRSVRSASIRSEYLSNDGSAGGRGSAVKKIFSARSDASKYSGPRRRRFIFEETEGIDSRASTELDERGLASHNSVMSGDERIIWHLHDTWTKQSNQADTAKHRGPDTFSSTDMFYAESEDEQDQEEIIYDHNSRWQKWMMLPFARKRFIWGIPGMVLISYDLITIPLEVFELKASAITTVIAWAGTMYWSTDIFMSFLTGFYVSGVIEMRPTKIARAYATSWLPIDLLTVIPDWLSIFLEEFAGESTSLARLSKSIRMVRMLRSVRLLRVPKLQKFVKELHDRINSEYTLSFLNVCQLLLLLVVISHFLACAWYGIGKTHSDGWIAQDEHRGKKMAYMYMTSLHWSLTQFQGTMEVNPTTTLERIFANVVLIIGLLGMSMLLSSITNMIMQLQKLNYNRTQQWWALRRYLKEQGIPVATGLRIKKYIKHLEGDSRLQKEDVRWLACLPEHLLMDIDYHIYNSILQVHKFFQSYGQTSLRALKMLIHRSLSCGLAARGDVIFNIGETAMRMVFIQKGRMLYTQRGNEIRVTLDQWVAEPVLWVQWVHLGELLAENTTDYLTLTHEEFARVTLMQLSTRVLAAAYAHSFVEKLNEVSEMQITDLTHMIIDPITSMDAVSRRAQFAASGKKRRHLEDRKAKASIKRKIMSKSESRPVSQTS